MMRSYYTPVTPGPRLLIPSFLCEIAIATDLEREELKLLTGFCLLET